MVKTFFIISLSILLILLLSFVLIEYYNTFYIINNIVIKVGIGIILIFITLVILRYMVLLFFSILKTTIKATEETKKTTNKKVSVIIPAYNEEKVIEKSIQSIINQTYKNIELIVVDDGSTDNTSLVVQKYTYLPFVKLYKKSNEGKAKAINYGIKRASGELIMVVDADSKLQKDAVELMAVYFEDPEIAAVAGSVFVSNQNNIITKLQALEYIEGLNMVRNGQAFLKLVNIIPGPIGMFRKKALYDVGLYDDDTFAEDCDVTLKLIAHGYKIDFESEAIAKTEAPENIFDLIKQRYRWTRGILQAIRKHKKLLWNFKDNMAASFTMWYMLFEAVFWPFMDFWVNVFILYLAITTGISLLIFYWWSLFTILDVAGALYCVLITNESLSIVFYAIFYRLFFIQFINLVKIFSTIEEWFGIKMEWGKLERKGRL